MILRRAEKSDVDSICDITNLLIRDTLITFTTKERDAASVANDINARGAAYLVAEIDNQVVGFATFGAFRSGPGYARTAEHTIQLAASARGLGVGRALMQRLETVARGMGLHVLVAGISAANPGAVTFHRKLGFQHVAHLPEVGFKHGQYLDLILMQKIL